VKEEKKERLQSLDVYRGLTILGMVFADHIEGMEGGFWWLVHPEWNGLTLADLVFPAFLFIMGVAIPLATSKSRPIRPKNVSRVFLLFGIGVLLNLMDSMGFADCTTTITQCASWGSCSE
jgi:heparan-alpha-glucosaminide N-acetyltransferase